MSQPQQLAWYRQVVTINIERWLLRSVREGRLSSACVFLNGFMARLAKFIPSLLKSLLYCNNSRLGASLLRHVAKYWISKHYNSSHSWQESPESLVWNNLSDHGLPSQDCTNPRFHSTLRYGFPRLHCSNWAPANSSTQTRLLWLGACSVRDKIDTQIINE